MSDKLTFYDDTHQYFLDGKELPSVTTILQPLANIAYGAIDPYVLKQAAERGTRIHQACEDFDLLGEFPDPEEDYDIYDYLLAYSQFRNDFEPIWYEIETQITDGKVAGTVDRIGKINKYDTVVVDIKSSSKIHTVSVSAQCYKYKDIFTKHYHGLYEPKLMVLQLRKDSTYKLVELDENTGRKAWDACWTIHELTKEEEKE